MDPNGKDTFLYKRIGGQLVDVKRGGKGKSPIYTVADDFVERSGKKLDLLWRMASPLTYTIGGKSKGKGITGKTLRKDHPLYNVGWKAGAQVYKEDLMDMSTQFDQVLEGGIPVFNQISTLPKPKGQTIWMLNSVRSSAFKSLVGTGRPFDLKSRNENDGTPSFSSLVIGEYSFSMGSLRSYDDYGNIAFGFLGKFAKFEDDELYYSANVAQRISTGEDDPERDQRMIETGIFNFHHFQKK